MSVEESFYGPWSVAVVQKVAVFNQRFRIRGSGGSDGYYDGVPGTIIARVTGNPWVLTMEWNDDVDGDWRPSVIRRHAAYTAADGLLVTLGGDDNFMNLADRDFDDLVIVCKCLDPEVDPIPLPANPLSFVIPRDWDRRPR